MDRPNVSARKTSRHLLTRRGASFTSCCGLPRLSPLVRRLREGGWMMRALAKIAVVCTVAMLVPSAVLAQAITGTVRDTSGAVMPGVTVEASSPALIEKVHTAVTDSAGLYRIVDLRP